MNEIEILESFTPVVAYIGTFDKIEQKSYVEYGEFLIRLNELKRNLKEISKNT